MQEIDTGRTEYASHWLADRGVREFGKSERQKIFTSLCEQVREMEYLPTLLESGEIGSIQPGTKALVFEIGGTKNRIHIVKADDAGYAHILPPSEDALTSMEMQFERRVFKNREDFYRTIIKSLEPGIEAIVRSHDIQALGIIYSFPGNAIRAPHGIDIVPDRQMTKEFVVPGIEKVGVGASFLEILRQERYSFASDMSLIVTNDVAAGMVNIAGAHLSLIDGTGFNVGVALFDHEQSIIWNTESGGLDFPLSAIESAIDEKSTNPGADKAEIIAGGANIGRGLNSIFGLMEREHERLMPYKVTHPISSVQLSDILTGNRHAFIHLLEKFNVSDNTTWNILEQIAAPIRDGAAFVIGSAIAAHLTVHADSFRDPDILCTAEGSTLLFTPGLAEGVLRAAKESAPDYTIRLIPTSGSTGVGFAALRQYVSQG